MANMGYDGPPVEELAGEYREACDMLNEQRKEIDAKDERIATQREEIEKLRAEQDAEYHELFLRFKAEKTAAAALREELKERGTDIQTLHTAVECRDAEIAELREELARSKEFGRSTAERLERALTLCGELREKADSNEEK